MNCPHNFKAGSIVRFSGWGHCDTCGGEIEIEGHWGYYLGDNSRGHVLTCMPRVHCTGCNNWLSRMHVPCGDQWRVKELEKEKELVR